MGSSNSKSNANVNAPTSKTELPSRRLQVTAMLKRANQQFPKNIATIDHVSGRRRTYKECVERVARLAGGLQGHGLSRADARGGRIALVMLNSDRYFESFFACSWAGGMVVPMNIRLAPLEMLEQFNDCQVEFIVVDDAFKGIIPQIQGKVPSLKKWIYAGESKDAPAGCDHYETLISSSHPVADANRGGDDTFGLYYTGGTTGKSKGVELTHSNIVVNALGHVAMLHYTHDSRYLHSAPMFHLADGASTFGITLVAGSHVFIPRFDPAMMLETIQTHKVTKAMMVPSMIAMMLQVKDSNKYDASSLQDIIYGASPMPEALLEPAMAKFPNAKFMQGYGMTETSPAITMLAPECHVKGNPKMRSVGRPVPWVEAKIVDEKDNEVPRGTVGEIVTRGPHVMKGYWNMPEKTAETLRNGWMHTEDGGFMDEDGFVFIVDRLKDMIITGGENVYSAEVENAIMVFPGIAMCAVIGTPDPKFVEIVTAVVVPAPGKTVDVNALLAHCRDRIAGYKIPRKVIIRDALPMSGAGKILKNELRKEFNTDALGKSKM